MSITLEQFNRLSELEATALLKTCVHIPSWITVLVASRPFATVACIANPHEPQGTGVDLPQRLTGQG